MKGVDLVVDWCSYDAAKYAVMHWHYSKTMPVGKLVKIGIWENGGFIGCIIYSLGSNKSINDNFDLDSMQACELTRVSMSNHGCFVSQSISSSIKMLKSQSPGLRLIVSYADPLHDHVGIVYQASNWLYIGTDSGDKDKRLRSYEDSKTGKVIPWRTMASILIKRGVTCSVNGATELGYIPLERKPKHKYLYPLDRAMRRQIMPLSMPYPKREDESKANS